MTPHAWLTPARCAADLAWLLRSEPLLSLETEAFSAGVQRFNTAQKLANEQWLQTLDSQALASFVHAAMPATAPYRLGRYAERLLLFYLQHNSDYQHLAHSIALLNPLPAAKDHTTQGELDFVFARQNEWHHWELAVKFFLCAGNTPQAFVGPARGGSDTLALKLNKLFNKQLAHPMPAPYCAYAISRAAFTRGWFFYQFEMLEKQCSFLNPLHPRGWWQTQAQFEAHAPWEVSHFVALPRLLWFSAYQSEALAAPLAVLNFAHMQSALQEKFSDADTHISQAGQLVAQVASTASGAWHEISRGFVMPNGAIAIPQT